MNWLITAWSWLSDEGNQKTLAFIGRGFAVLLGAAWKAYLYWSDKKNTSKASQTIGHSAVSDVGSGSLEGSIPSPTIFNVPIPRNPFFTGRSDILEKLHEKLNNKHEIALTPTKKATALSGLGGVGKTQTVAEYAYRYQTEYSAVLWVLADDKELLRSSFAQLSVLLGFKAEKQDDKILAVQSWLRTNTGWLLIFDNAETLELLTAAKALLPSHAQGHVLFTTRAQATGDVSAVSVDYFDNDTGAVFLERVKKPSLKWGAKSSSSAAQGLTIHQLTDAEACFTELRKNFKKIYTTHLSTDAVGLLELNLTEPVALVFGNEHSGVSDDIIAMADGNFIIPQVGIIKSLNISVACAVTLYEAFRQKTNAGHYDHTKLEGHKLQSLRAEWGFLRED